MSTDSRPAMHLNATQQSSVALSDSIEVPLTRGLVARVSAEDADRVLGLKWHAVPAGPTFYAVTRRAARTIYMHRRVLGLEFAPRAVFVDHINHDGLDNRRINLRESDAKQNAQNKRCARDYLGLRGIRPVGARWEAQIKVAGRLIFLGSFPTQREAGIAYAAACRAIGRSVD